MKRLTRVIIDSTSVRSSVFGRTGQQVVVRFSRSSISSGAPSPVRATNMCQPSILSTQNARNMRATYP
jgi:hypothetical protein